MNDLAINALLHLALEEDIGTGDITTLSCIPEDRQASAVYRAKESGIICGLEVVEKVFMLLDEKTRFKALVKDGSRAETGDIIATVSGSARSILSGERVGLNLLQHLSGIATRTASAVEAVAGYKAKITDTRKSTPGLRVLEKYAVRIGGGSNHRFNLSDGVLIKDNHIVAAGGIKSAVAAAKAMAPHTLRIEVEVSNLGQLGEALDAGAEIIMLDNMSVAQMTEACRIVNCRAIIEASGNMGERNLTEVAATGVDLISIGALTHSVRAMDISLQFNEGLQV